ncbi:MAG: hypothetical protein Q9220_004733 [cf. Caloplaca sp. 1 TL-2023]
MAEFSTITLTTAQSQAMYTFLGELRDELPTNITYGDLVAKISIHIAHYITQLRSREIDLQVIQERNYSNAQSVKEAMADYQDALDIATIAYLHLSDRATDYWNARRLLMCMVKTKIHKDIEKGILPDVGVSESYEDMWMELEMLSLAVSGTWSQKDVLSELKREWRRLGPQEERKYETLYQYLTGHALQNE